VEGLNRTAPFFGDDAIEDGVTGKGVEEVVRLAAGDEQQLHARPSRPVQRAHRVLVHSAVVGECAVVIGGEGFVRVQPHHLSFFAFSQERPGSTQTDVTSRRPPPINAP